MTILVSPLFHTPEEAIDWLAARGATRFLLWPGPDGLVRGNGLVTT